MFRRSLRALGFTRHGHARSPRRIPVVNELEPRCLLSGDLTTTAQVTAITVTPTGTSSIVEPMKTAYALNSTEALVNFTASDPGDTGPALVTNFQVTDLTTNTTIMSGTGSSVLLTAQGVYSVQFWSTDSDDSEAVGAHSILIGLDRTAPAVTIDTVSPSTLWPPNGKLVTVTVTGYVTDTLPGTDQTLTGVNPSSLTFDVHDEYGMVQPSGPITTTTLADPTAFGGDSMVQFSFQVQLQARRFGYDFDGRQYSIVVDARDEAGNLGAATAFVTVPHDMGHHFGNSGGGGGNGGISQGPPNFGGGRSHGNGHHGGRGNGFAGSNHGHGHHQSISFGGGSSGRIIPVTIDPGKGHGHGKGSHGHGNGHGHGG